jgi:para-aminobenzoate synthetase component 1
MVHKILGPLVDSTALLQAIEELPGRLVLESTKHNPHFGNWSFYMVEPFDLIEMNISDGDGFAELSKKYNEFCHHDTNRDHRIPFCSGAAGFAGYECGRWIEELPGSVGSTSSLPDLYFGLYSASLAVNHAENRVILSSDPRLPAAERTAKALEEAYHKCLHSKPAASARIAPSIISPEIPRALYIEKIKAIRDYILAGDIYQANFTQKFSTEHPASVLEIYNSLKKTNPAPFAAFIDLGGDRHILSSSPERFFEKQGAGIITRPIKGTRPRGKTPQEDRRLADELLGSIKDRSELLMIVDLERNDLSRICIPGSVKVPELFQLESYETVHHLVSTVKGTLKPGSTAEEIWKAMFPGGSITGTPKIRAMKIIDELEQSERKVYTGAVGYMDFNGNWDSNIAIRTMVHEQGRYWYQTGGGIVWDSDPEEEYEESLTKGIALAKALNGKVREEA